MGQALADQNAGYMQVKSDGGKSIGSSVIPGEEKGLWDPWPKGRQNHPHLQIKFETKGRCTTVKPGVEHDKVKAKPERSKAELGSDKEAEGLKEGYRGGGVYLYHGSETLVLGIAWNKKKR